MLYFIDEKNGDVEWHVGDPLPPNMPRVVTLQADCHELEVILRALEATRRER